MKQKLLLFFALFCFLAGNAQVNDPRSSHYLVPCDNTLAYASCNLIVNPAFHFSGDSLEAFSNGNVPMWGDINNLTTDINGALAIGTSWTIPTVPANLAGTNFASMLVDNYYTRTEGIAGRIFQVDSGHKYALSFFLASSALTDYLPLAGDYTLKIFLANCQHFDSTYPGNPEIAGDKQLIFCRTFSAVEDSTWQQYLVNFTADNDYNMIVIYPEVVAPYIAPVSDFRGTYVHFLYPELIPINPASQYITYNVPGWTDTTDINNPIVHPDSTKGYTVLSACGLINASYQWTGPNGVVSHQQIDVLGHDPAIGENDEYIFSMLIDSAVGNDTGACRDAAAPVIIDTAFQRLTTERLDLCAHEFTPPYSCNLIPNPTYTLGQGPPPPTGYFIDDSVPFWSAINGSLSGVALATFFPPLPPNIPGSVRVAGLQIQTKSFPTLSYTSNGINAKIPQLDAGHKYAFSFYLKKFDDSFGGADFTLKVVLSNCQMFLGTSKDYPPDLSFIGNHQDIFCQSFSGTTVTGWERYLVTFTADEAWTMISIYPQGNLAGVGITNLYILMPQLIDVTNLISVTQNSCSYTLETCGLINASYEWTDGDGNTIGTTNPITIDAEDNPPLYTLTLLVPGVVNINSSNTCSNNTASITALAFGNQATWVGGSGSILATQRDWYTAANWDPATVPNNLLTDVIIPSTTYQPFIASGTGPIQVNSITLGSGASLINNDILQIARNITGPSQSIDNRFYDPSIPASTSVITGSIEMNGTCKEQTLAGDVFKDNDVKDLTVSNNVTITSGLDIHGKLEFGSVTSTTLATGGYLTLVSNASTTAYVAKITDATNFISGNVTVERHILTGTGGGEHTKKWQALATPTGANSTSQSVYDSWMEGGITASTNYGTHIPDPSWTSATTYGFDAYAFIPSIKTYNSSTNGFDPIANTAISLYNKNGYFLFVRGDRSVTDLATVPVRTNLRSKGALFQPYTGYPPPSVNVPLTIPGTPTIYKFAMVGNPYASAIDIQYMNSHGYFTNLTNDVIVWDPLLAGTLGLGGYQTLHASSGYKPTPGGTALYDVNIAYPEIQSGQAFFVGTPANSTVGLISFDEAIKSGNSRLVTRQVGKQKSFRANLYYGTNICDGNITIFDNSFKNEIDANDAGKFFNPGENFMITTGRKDVFLAVETKHSLIKADSIFYAFSNLRQMKYQLVFAPENLEEEGFHAILIDNYLHQRTYLSLLENSFIDFIVDEHKTSYENRFMIVFDRDEIFPGKPVLVAANKNEQVTAGSFIIQPNPTENKTIRISFVNQASGRYSVQMVDHAGKIVYKNSLQVTSANTTNLIKLPNSIASGSYELVVIAVTGKRSSQQVIVK